MSDIIICSGGEALNFSPTISPGENVLIVTCDDDLHMCKGSMDAGVPVHSTELILGGVLRQELDLHSYPIAFCNLSILRVCYMCMIFFTLTDTSSQSFDGIPHFHYQPSTHSCWPEEKDKRVVTYSLFQKS